MPNKLQELLSSIIGQLKEIATTETIVGKPVTMGDKSVVPVSRLAIGFGVGGGEGERKGTESGFGGGGGGGAKVEPVGFIIIDGEKVSFLPTSHSKFEGLIEAIPDLIGKIRTLKKEIVDKSKKEPPKEEAKGE